VTVEQHDLWVVLALQPEAHALQWAALAAWQRQTSRQVRLLRIIAFAIEVTVVQHDLWLVLAVQPEAQALGCACSMAAPNC
jgi:hypothetical protein